MPSWTDSWLVTGTAAPGAHFCPLRQAVLTPGVVVGCVLASLTCSAHLFVLFLLSPLHPPLSVCQNTDGPLLGPCHLVSICVSPRLPPSLIRMGFLWASTSPFCEKWGMSLLPFLMGKVPLVSWVAVAPAFIPAWWWGTQLAGRCDTCE